MRLRCTLGKITAHHQPDTLHLQLEGPDPESGTGSTHLVKVWPSEKAGAVIAKMRLARKYASGQRLMLGSRWLRTYEQLRGLGIEAGPVLRLEAPPAAAEFIEVRVTVRLWSAAVRPINAASEALPSLYALQPQARAVTDVRKKLLCTLPQ